MSRIRAAAHFGESKSDADRKLLASALEELAGLGDRAEPLRGLLRFAVWRSEWRDRACCRGFTRARS